MDAPLNFAPQQGNVRFERAEPEDASVFEIIEQLFSFVRRQYPVFVFGIASAVALGLVYYITTPSTYTSHAMLLIDSSKARLLQQQQQASLGDIPIDTAQVETQVEILKSENIALSVIKDLKLAADPEFAGSGGGLLGRMLSLFAGTESSETQQNRKSLVTFLAKRLVERTSWMSVSHR
jgi:succinoglycan biosynthesis transport protein ExoP